MLQFAKLDVSQVILFLIIFPFLAVESRPERGSYTSAWCNATELYRPYLKYYFGGRTSALKGAPPDRSYPPGQYWDFRQKQNTFVCVNGMAWLYYAKFLHETGVMVLHKPELHSFRHDCLLTNYKKGPVAIAPTTDERLLYSILLMGHPEDYRKPSIALLPAPAPLTVWDAANAAATGSSKLISTGNYTIGNSLVIIGDETECILLRGKEKTPVRIRTGDITANLPDLANPDEVTEYQGSFCKMSYSSLSNVADDDVNLHAPLTQNSLEYANEALKGAGDLVKQGCYIPEDYDVAGSKTVVENRVTALEALDKNPKDPKNVLQPTADYLTNVLGYTTAFKAETMANVTVETVLNFAIDPAAGNPCEWDIFEVTSLFGNVSCKLVYPPPTPPDTAVIPPCNPCQPGNKAKLATFIDIQKSFIKLQNNKSSIPNPNAPDAANITAASEAMIKAQLLNCLHDLWAVAHKLGSGTPSPFLEAVKDAWGTSATPAAGSVIAELDALAAARTAAEAKPDDKALSRAVFTAKQAVAGAVSVAETLSRQLRDLMRVAQQIYGDFDRNLKSVKGGGRANCGIRPLPFKSDVITVKRGPKAEYIQPLTGPDTTMYPAETKKTCGELPKPQDSCSSLTPGKERACQLLKARMSKFETLPAGSPVGTNATIVDWEPKDKWRSVVMGLIADIFTQSCNPMVKSEYAHGINAIIKGYLLDFVKGSLANVHVDVLKVPGCTSIAPAPPCETERVECDTGNAAHLAALGGTSTAPTECPVGKIPPHRDYWKVLMAALEKCKLQDKKQLKFKLMHKDGDKSAPIYVLLVNGSSEVTVEPNTEQADEEYAFNLAIDGFWKMFSTVLGVCMPGLEETSPQITNQFYSFFSEDFLAPLGREWRRNRDNKVLAQILGGRFGPNFWLGHCLESSFLRAGDVGWRPPRKLLVNGKTEMNFYTDGPITKPGKQRLIAYSSF